MTAATRSSRQRGRPAPSACSTRTSQRVGRACRRGWPAPAGAGGADRALCEQHSEPSQPPLPWPSGRCCCCCCCPTCRLGPVSSWLLHGGAFSQALARAHRQRPPCPRLDARRHGGRGPHNHGDDVAAGGRRCGRIQVRRQLRRPRGGGARRRQAGRPEGWAGPGGVISHRHSCQQARPAIIALRRACLPPSAPLVAFLHDGPDLS